jgi:hypothetical protein
LGLDVVESGADVSEKGVGHEPPRFDDGEAASLTAHNGPRYGDTWSVSSSRPRLIPDLPARRSSALFRYSQWRR